MLGCCEHRVEASQLGYDLTDRVYERLCEVLQGFGTSHEEFSLAAVVHEKFVDPWYGELQHYRQTSQQQHINGDGPP